MIRTRWAAVGAAVAVTLGAGGIGLVNAAIGEGERTVFVPIEPCRLFDTRPEFNVGPKTTPLGEQETHSVKGVGEVGDCVLPNDAVGLVLNVTAVDATAPTFLTIWENGVDRPNASHLNPLPGDGPAPNAVTTNLGADDEFNVFNRFGNVHVLADVVGYYADHHHDDRYYPRDELYTKAETDAALDELYTRAETDAALDDLVLPRAHGEVFHSGGVGRAENMSSSNVTNPETGVYCIRSLSFTPVNAIVSPTNQFNSGHNDVRVHRYDGADFDCPSDTQIQVHVFTPGTTNLKQGNFAIVIF